MLVGLPCLSTNVGDADKMLDEEYLPQSDATSLYEAVSRLCEMDESARRKVGGANSKVILQRYSMERVIQEYSKLYLDSVA